MSRQDGGVVGGVHLMDAAPASCKNGSNNTGQRHASGVDCTAGSGNGGGGASCGVSVDYGLLEIDENDNSFPWGLIHHNELAQMLNAGLGKTMVIDSRSFLEYNTSTIQQSVNVCCSKLVKRRLQQDKVHVLDLLNQTCNIGADTSWDVIVYDQCTEDPSQLTSDNFVAVLLHKLSTTFNSVAFLKGGFLSFQASHPGLTENKSSAHRCSTLTSLSQPCMPVSNVGPTRILPFLYLGSQQDSLNQEVAQVNGITYILNVSKTCPRPHFILEGHFHRIPVNDNYCEKLLPFFQEAFQFLDKVREANGCVLIHCLGGVSRSATLAIAYIMRYYRMSSDEAYRYVKDKRPTISPNFNFLGQLLEYERSLRQEEQEEVVRRKMMKDEEGGCGEFDRASPGVMDLHTSSPSSPGPRTAQRPFAAGSLPSLLQSRTISSYVTSASSVLGRVVRESLVPGAAPLTKLMNQSASERQACIHRHLNSATDIPPLPGPSSGPTTDTRLFPGPTTAMCPFPGPTTEMCPFPGPVTDMCPFPGPTRDMCPFPGPAMDTCPFLGPATEMCPFPGPATDMCPFPGPSLEFPGASSEKCSFSGSSSNLCPFPGPQTEPCPMTESPHKKGPDPQHACLSAAERNRETNVISTTVHVSHGLCSTKQTMALFCDNPRQNVLAPAPVCPLTGFPSPDGANGGFPGSTCPQTGFPGPGSHGSSCAAPRPTAVTTDNPGLTSTSAASETLFKNTSTYHHLNESSAIHAVSSPQSNDSDSKHDLFHKSSQKEQTRPRHGFNLYSMLSNLRWKSRPPTLSLGSPVGPVKDGNRHAKKHTVENSVDGRLQLTPVSEAMENCDLITSDIVAADGVNRSTSLQSSCTESMEVSESDIATNVHEFGSNIFNATTTAMASTQSNLSSTLASSPHTRSNSDSILVTSASPPLLSSVASSVVKPTKLSIAIKKFTLPLSSPTSSFPAFPVSLLPSPGDSNKRKGFPASCSDSPDKLAKTEVGSHHCSPSPPTTLNLTLSPVGEKKLKLASKRPFVLPISSPTAATADYLAMLRVTLPSEPACDKDKQQGQMDIEDDHKSRRSSCSDLETETKAHFSTESRDSLRRLHIKSRDPYGHTKWKSAGSLTVTESTVFGGAQFSTLQHKDTSLFSSIVGSSSSSSSSSSSTSVSLSSSSLLSKSCTSIYSPSWVISSAISSSRAVNLQGFSQFPTTSLDKLSFTPCYTKDIVQELRKQESEQPATPEQGTSPSEGNLGPSVLDSPMSISSGSSAPSVASSTLSPVESTMTNPFSGGSTTAHTSSSAFPFTQSQSSPDSSVPSFGSAHEDEGYPNPALSPSSTSDFILSPSSLPQSTVAPTIPTLSSPYYCGSQSMESLSPMSLSDSSSSSPIRSPTRNGITSPLPSSIGSPSSSVSSPVVSSPPFSPLISSPVSSSSHMAGTVASNTSSITTKVVLRRDKNRRVLDRPNSIAFSSYPTCDLVPAASSDSSSLGQASQDDSSEAYMSSKSKRSRSSNHPESHASHGRTSWGGYSEREMYRQITAAMENAMLRTQVFSASSSSRGKATLSQVSSRKSRSLDDILDSNADEDEFLPSRTGGAPWSRHRAEMSMFEKYRCGMQNVSEPYHSNSSISSSGSHTGSMEIQLPR